MTFYFYRSHVNADGRRVYKNAAGQEVLAGNPDIRYSARYQQNESAAQLFREENAGLTEDVAGRTAPSSARPPWLKTQYA